MSSPLSLYCTNILAIELCRTCRMIQCTADSGVICDTLIACTNLGEICLRAASPTDLGGLYCKSYDLPDSSIPALPSYDLTDLPASCASCPMTQCIRSKSTVARMGKGSGNRACAPLDLIHVDLIINASHVTEHTCMLVLVDNHSKYIYAQPLL